MTTEGAGGSELAELVTYHVLGNIDGNKLVAIVNGKVCPTNSGAIIDARDQVLITLFLPLSFMASTFFSSFTLM